MELKVDVDEADVGAVQEGQAATFTVDAYPDEHFPARITSLHFASSRAQDVVTYEAVLEVANEQLKLRPGMTAVADIIVSEVQDALLVPNAALRFTPDDSLMDASLSGDEKFPSKVWILDEHEPVSIPVKTGRTDGRYTEIPNVELSEGTRLVVDVMP